MNRTLIAHAAPKSASALGISMVGPPLGTVSMSTPRPA
jgi:hypothetical protein